MLYLVALGDETSSLKQSEERALGQAMFAREYAELNARPERMNKKDHYREKQDLVLAAEIGCACFLRRNGIVFGTCQIEDPGHVS